MARIEFKAKVRNVHNIDGTMAFRVLDVPTLTRSHCNVNAFRQHAKFGGLANSDLFLNVLARIKRERLGERIRLDKIPDGVAVDETGFLAVVTIDV